VTLPTGRRVRVSARAHEGHHRTPGYLKGRTGTVERGHGVFTNPEARAYGADGYPEQRLYLVGFDQREMWPAYAGDSRDRIYVDVFEHWLEDPE
jgi:nitrile hydratase subunit beta